MPAAPLADVSIWSPLARSSRERGAIDLDLPGVPGAVPGPIIIVRVDQVSEAARLEPAAQEGEEAVEGLRNVIKFW